MGTRNDPLGADAQDTRIPGGCSCYPYQEQRAFCRALALVREALRHDYRGEFSPDRFAGGREKEEQ